MANGKRGSAPRGESTKELELALRHGDLALVRVYVRRLQERGAPAGRMYDVAATRVPRAPSLETLMEAPPNVVPMLRLRPDVESDLVQLPRRPPAYVSPAVPAARNEPATASGRPTLLRIPDLVGPEPA